MNLDLTMSQIGLRGTYFKVKPSYTDLQPIRDILDTGILDMSGIFLAGASLQALVCPEDDIVDYDIFFTDKNMVIYAEAMLKQRGFKIDGFVFADPFMHTYRKGSVVVQLIFKEIYRSVEHCLNTFDFNCTLFAYSKGELTTTMRAVTNVKDKVLTINELLYPVSTWERIGKYMGRKGYSLSLEVEEQIKEAVRDDEGHSYFYEGDERAANSAVNKAQRKEEGIGDFL